MAEFCDPDKFRVISAKSPTDYIDYSLREMLPEVGFVVDSSSYGYKGDK